MLFSRRFRALTRSASLSCAALLAACSDSGDGAAAPAPDVQISADNVQLVAKLALDSALGLVDVAGIGVGVLSTRPPSTQGLDLRRFVGRRLWSIGASAGGLLAAVLTQVEQGPLGGSVTYLWDDRDDDQQVSSGDSFENIYAAFAEDTLVLDGLVTIDQLTVQGDPSVNTTWRLGARMTFHGLGVTEGAATGTLTGEVACAVEERPTVALLGMRLLTSVVAADATSLPGNTVDYSEFVSDTSFRITSRGAAQAEAVGTITYATAEPFAGFAFDPYPSAGVLEVQGASGSRVTITVVDGTTVQLETDADGDGVVDDTRTVLWTEL